MLASNKINRQVVTAVVGAALSLTAVTAFGATDLTTVAAGWKTQLASALEIAKIVFVLIGFLLFGTGLLFFYKDNKQPGQGHLKTGFVALLVGSALLIIPWMLGMFTNTVADDTQGAAATSAAEGNFGGASDG